MIFVMVKCYAFFVVGTDFLNIIYTSFGSIGLIHDMCTHHKVDVNAYQYFP
jgi:hypothetical protein